MRTERRLRRMRRLACGIVIALVLGVSSAAAQSAPDFPRSVTLAVRATVHKGSSVTLHGKLKLGRPSPRACPPPVGIATCESPLEPPPPPAVAILARHGRDHAFGRVGVVEWPHDIRQNETLYTWQLRVRPRRDTTYVAVSRAWPSMWQPARSRAVEIHVTR
jgi:hypothetical protein